MLGFASGVVATCVVLSLVFASPAVLFGGFMAGAGLAWLSDRYD